MAMNVRIDPVDHARLVEVARAQHIPLTEALSRAIAAYRREQLIQQMSADYAAMRSDPRAVAEEEAERALWDRALADGLTDEPPHPDRGPSKRRSRRESVRAR